MTSQCRLQKSSRSQSGVPASSPPVDTPPPGGLPLGGEAIEAFWYWVFATLPEPTDQSPTQEAVCQPSEQAPDESVAETARQAGGLCYEKALEDILVIGKCLNRYRSWQRRTVDHGAKKPHYFYVYEYLFLDLENT